VRTGVRLALDVGSVRIGVARSDATGMLAVPLDAIRAGDVAVAAVVGLVREWDALEVYVGLPLHMDGREGAASERARTWARALSTRQSRSLIDSASAVMVLQSVLEAESGTGKVPGDLVLGDDGA